MSDGNVDDQEFRFVAIAMELRLWDLLLAGEPAARTRAAAAETFHIAGTLAWPDEPLEAARRLVELGCIAVIGDRTSDFRRIVTERGFPDLPLDSDDWGIRVQSTILLAWLLLLGKRGRDNLEAVREMVVAIRGSQREYEPGFLKEAEMRKDVHPAWALMANYHLAKAAEILAANPGQGLVDSRSEIRAQLETQFDFAINASYRGRLIELENMSWILVWAARIMVDNGI